MEIEEAKENKKPQVSMEDRWEIVHLKRNKVNGPEISQRLDIPVSTVNAIYRKWEKEGTVENKKQPGRPKRVTEEEEKMFIEAADAHPGRSLNELRGEIDASFSKTTAHNLLTSYGFEYITIPEKWALTNDHRKLRLAWAMKYVDKPDTFWQRVIFTDESLIQGNPNKQKAWVTDKTSLQPIEKDRWSASILCWGAISYEGTSMLECIFGTMNADIYLKILKRRLLRNLPALSPKSIRGARMERLIYQQDGASSHTAKDVLKYFREKEIEVLSWPPKSPDLNLIENIWGELKRKLKRSYERREELVEDIENCWNSISVEFVQKLYNSMNHRILAVIAAEGGPTKY